MRLEFSDPDDVIEMHNEVVGELEPLVGELVTGEFYKAVSFIGDHFARRLLTNDVEFDLQQQISNIVYICMKVGYGLCEKQMKVN